VTVKSKTGIISVMMVLTIARWITNSVSTRRLPCQCPCHRIRFPRGHRRGRAPSTADLKPCPAHAAAIAPDPTSTPVPARPAAAGGGAAGAAAIPGSLRPTSIDGLCSWIFCEQVGQLLLGPGGIKPALSAWESDRSRPVTPLTSRLRGPLLPVSDRRLPWLIARRSSTS
jgi:hypothetical protein